jgi:hypothetical protein
MDDSSVVLVENTGHKPWEVNIMLTPAFFTIRINLPVNIIHKTNPGNVFHRVCRAEASDDEDPNGGFASD